MVSSTGLTGIHSDSEYNDGKGIHYVVNFRAQLPPLEANEKRRLNARAPVINHSFYAHESSSLAEVLDGAIGIVGRNLPFKIVSKQLRTNKFSVTYTVPRTSLKEMQLGSENDFKVLWTQRC
ncbi:hypothetical protein B0H14DRAFT_2567392 [Mycena olivaceomarginata]|nr:hypothetical protein B0H14DRAFT_2567392 [Mycena olivaceomarginata]